jgi:phospholipid/cholesterol/gamma-HCH transport system substrate-binding protein
MSPAKPLLKPNARRAGLFVLIGLVALGVVIFMIGQKSALFVRTAKLHVYFEDISGLVAGAPVRLAGLDVGTVTAIAFPEDLKRKQARVTLVVNTKFMPRVRRDSLAFVDSKGLLGDKIVNISIGDPAFPQMKDGETLRTGSTLSFEALSKDIHTAVTSFTELTDEARLVVVGVRQRGVDKDIAEITSSLAGILKGVEQGDGLAHRLIYDARYADQVGVVLREAGELGKRASQAAERVDRILAEVEAGDGTLHEVIYGNKGSQALGDLQAAAAEIAAVTKEIREGEGLIHTLVYEEDNTNFLKELDQMAITLNKIVQEVDAGKGSVGALLKDPTIYEDLKELLGNVKRNVMLKALIRFTIDNEALRRDSPTAKPAAE